MPKDDYQSFAEELLKTLFKVWDINSVKQFSNITVPDNIVLNRRTLYAGDLNLLWANWFIESICHLANLSKTSTNYVHIYSKVIHALPHFLSDLKDDEIKEVAKPIAKIILNDYLKRIINRDDDSNLKETLLSLYNPPRCWICGYKFSDTSVSNFLDGSKPLPEQPRYVDKYMPRGMNELDYKITIEHVLPISQIGDNELDNIRLTCHWCNNAKSDNTLLYETSFSPRVYKLARHQIIELPPAFWVIRLLGMIGKCEHPDGCDKTKYNTELTIAPRNLEGKLNPTNIMLVCTEHDPIKSSRYALRSEYERMR